MATLTTQGIEIYYELFGDRSKPPVMLLHGLGGGGRSWGSHVERFARDHFVILPDQRGVGRSSRANDGYTMAQMGRDMTSLVDHLDVGPVHVVGSSTGGAIAQVMALDHPACVRSITLASSFARFDAYMTREFALRRRLMAEVDVASAYEAYALFLFSPRYQREKPEAVETWIKRAAAGSDDREIALARIDMVAAHDTVARLGAIEQPTLVICGELDFCVPLPNSEELARAISGAELSVLAGGGHFIHVEKEELFFETVSSFLARH